MFWPRLDIGYVGEVVEFAIFACPIGDVSDRLKVIGTNICHVDSPGDIVGTHAKHDTEKQQNDDFHNNIY